MNKPVLTFFTLVIGIGLGGTASYFYSEHYLSPMQHQMPAMAKQTEKQQKPLFYRNPMNPDVTSPIPAKDNMGMDYIAVYAENNTQTDMSPIGTVKIDPVTVQNMGVRSTVAISQSLSHEIRAMGRVAYDEENISRLHPKTEGWVDKLFIDKTGTRVKKGDILLSVYSPQLVTSSQEYLLALKSHKTLVNSPFEDIRFGAQQMVQSARERLAFLDVPEHQIEELEQTGIIEKYIHIHSPFDGAVINIGVREGEHISPKTELYMLADLSKVWVLADVFEADLPWINTGDPVEMTLLGIPDKIFKGSLSYIYPYAEAKTRSIKVRLVFDNKDFLLKPDMFANITIHTKVQANAIVIPSEAIVRSGIRDIVFVVREPGKFEPKTVKTGLSAAGLTQIIDGIDIGDKVVTSSQFLIDSESSLHESTARMLETLKKDKVKTKPDLDTTNQAPKLSMEMPENQGSMSVMPAMNNSAMGVRKHD